MIGLIFLRTISGEFGDRYSHQFVLSCFIAVGGIATPLGGIATPVGGIAAWAGRPAAQ